MADYQDRLCDTLGRRTGGLPTVTTEITLRNPVARVPTLTPYRRSVPTSLILCSRLLAVVLALVFGTSAVQAAMPLGCAAPGTRLLAGAPLDRAGSMSSLVLIDPAVDHADRLPIRNPRSVTPTLQPGTVIVADASGRDHLVRLVDGRTAPLHGAIRAVAEITQSFTAVFRPSRWITLRTYDATGLRLRIVDRTRDRAVVDTLFPRRIEIAATVTSPDGRTVAHLQANNVASELTVFDAETGRRHEIRIPHDASLAAYAVSLSFSPDASCLAVSIARDAHPPESWVIDLRQPGPAATPISNVFVLAWSALP